MTAPDSPDAILHHDSTMSITPRVHALVHAVEQGRALEAFEAFYADDVVMQENAGEPVRGKPANLEREREFALAIAEIHEIRLLAHAVGDGVSFSEWRFDLTMADGERVRLDQVAVRRWRDGLVVDERFYVAG